MPHASSYPSLPPDVGTPSNAATIFGEGPGPWWPQDPRYDWHVLAEGDSWFTIAAIPSSRLLYEFLLALWTQIFNLAYPGDKIRPIANLVDNEAFSDTLRKPGFCWRWDAILLSGGGNDLIEAAPQLIRREPRAGSNPKLPASYVEQEKLEELLQHIRAAFRTIVQLRDDPNSPSAGCPIVVHTYDYPTPRNEPARFLNAVPLAGPWLYPVLAATALDLPMQQAIVGLLIDSMAEALLALDSTEGAAAGTGLPNFHVVDTRHTLIMANPMDVGVSHDWLNEIHPSHDGYRKIAARISAKLNQAMLR